MSRNLLFGRVSGNEIGVGASAGFIRWTGYPGDGTIIPLAAHGIQAGDTVTLTAKISSTSGKQLRLRLEFYESEAHRDSKMSTEFCQNSIKTLSLTTTVPEGFTLFRVGLDANLTGGTITTNTQETITEVMLVHGDKPAVWTPAPEDMLFTSLAHGDIEQGIINWGPPSAGKTYQEMKINQREYVHIRARTTNLIPLLGKSVYYVNIPIGLMIIPYYFDSAGLSLGTDDSNWRTGMRSYTAPSGAAYVAVYFSNADSTTITPADVTNVTGGGYSLMAIKARASIQLEDFSGELKDLEDKTIINATALEQRLSTQILQSQEQIQQTVTEQYFTKDETNRLIQEVSTAFTQTAEGWQMNFNKLVSVVNANQASTDSEFQNWSKYIRFVDGNIILGQAQNPIILTIKNDRISFAQSGQEVAYLSNSELTITDARITHSLRIGYFGWVPRANGSLDLKKVS